MFHFLSRDGRNISLSSNLEYGFEWKKASFNLYCSTVKCHNDITQIIHNLLCVDIYKYS